MDIIANWKMLSERKHEEKSEVITKLASIHMNAFDDLRKSGHMLSINGQKLSDSLHGMEVQERLELAGQIGCKLAPRQMADQMGLIFDIEQADFFPHCIFIWIAAQVENLEGSVSLLFTSGKMEVVCNYATIDGNDNPLGKLLPVLEECFPWVQVVEKVTLKEKPAPEKPILLPYKMSSVIFVASGITPITTMRTGFTGKLLKGVIRRNDILSVTDGSGRVITREGAVLMIVMDGKEVDRAEAGQSIDELGLAVEIPKGEYTGILLIDGIKTLHQQIEAHVAAQKTAQENARQNTQDAPPQHSRPDQNESARENPPEKPAVNKPEEKKPATSPQAAKKPGGFFSKLFGKGKK